MAVRFIATALMLLMVRGILLQRDTISVRPTGRTDIGARDSLVTRTTGFLDPHASTPTVTGLGVPETALVAAVMRIAAARAAAHAEQPEQRGGPRTDDGQPGDAERGGAHFDVDTVRV